MVRKFLSAAAALALLVWLSVSFNLPLADAKTLSPDEILNSDGTLNLTQGQVGTVDVRGWNITLDPQRGPVLAPNAPTAEGWSDLNQGVSGNVMALAVSGNNVYVGGEFQNICADSLCLLNTLRVNGIAKWDGAAWSKVKNGVKGNVRAIAVSNDEVYVGGYFTEVCGNDACNSGNLRVNNIARLTSGNVWVKLFYGVDDIVNALAVAGNNVYVGGEYENVCGNDTCSEFNTRTNHIVKWNGGSWSQLGFGVNKQVLSVAAVGNQVYIGGVFEVACGNAACDSQGSTIVNYVAHWTGTNWAPMQAGVDGFVYKVLVTGTGLIHTVYIGGTFTELCGDVYCNSQNVGVNRIAKWNGTSWSALGSGVNNFVFGMASNADGLYVAGLFSEVCGNSTCNNGNLKVNRIAKWNGASWSPVAYGVSSQVAALVTRAGDVYAAGNFKSVCGNEACDNGNSAVNRVAKYNPQVPNPCDAKPVKPKLKKPANGATLAATHANLKWKDVSCETKYKVIVKQQDNNSTAFKKTLGADETQRQTDEMTTGKTFKWFVKACNSFGCSKSSKRTFTLIQ